MVMSTMTAFSIVFTQVAPRLPPIFGRKGSSLLVCMKIKNIEYKPMDIEEAIMQMDLINSDFLVFTNARTNQVNVLYGRKDGHYGLIQPGTG